MLVAVTILVSTALLRQWAAKLVRYHALQDDRLLSGAVAFAAMWRAIPLLRALGFAARKLWLSLEPFAVSFLRVRPFLQRALGNQGH